jgi:hypothetical protein
VQLHRTRGNRARLATHWPKAMSGLQSIGRNEMCTSL